MSKKIKITLIAVIVLFIAGMAFYPVVNRSFLQKREEGKASPQEKGKGNGNDKKALNINAKIIKYESLDDIFLSKGRLLPDEEVDLSFETSGKITHIYFKEGTFVRKGELLAKVNDAPLQAELKKLEAQLPLAQDRVFRQKSLLEKDAVSQEAYESVNTDLEKLNADIELVKAQIDQTELRAPFDGLVGLRMVSEGAYASPTTNITRLTKITPLKIEFSVNEAQASAIKPGTELHFSLVKDLNKYAASVYAIESNLDQQTFMLKARALYPNTDGRLKPGYSVNIEIKLQEIKNAIIVPSMSVVAEMGRSIAYVYRDGKAHQAVLEKGMRTANSVQIVEGLSVGDTLITTGVMQLRDGMPIVIDHLNDDGK
ncbi:MAG: efflux RND transporter periplasmic adaptor subunit [Prevotella sp.]|jgi:membrane fusion protein (multidrug efflux system)|nr:efflux RND transporter periplasmic adaptor subunit [Prevotella sp.]